MRFNGTNKSPIPTGNPPKPTLFPGVTKGTPPWTHIMKADTSDGRSRHIEIPSPPRTGSVWKSPRWYLFLAMIIGSGVGSFALGWWFMGLIS